jgi:hypothetical protein
MNELYETVFNDNSVDVYNLEELIAFAIAFAEKKKTLAERKDVIFTQLKAILSMQMRKGVCKRLERLTLMRLKPYKYEMNWSQLTPLLVHISKGAEGAVPSDYPFKHLI